MTRSIDHIFVCSAFGAPEAQALIDAGFVEGSSNIHPGQGTSNRRFFFEQGFLELLWVHDEGEARSALTAQTRLWERWSQRGQQANPFGICFSWPSVSVQPLPFKTWPYQPAYLPSDKRIYFADNVALSEPELFALSWPQSLASADAQPKAHSSPLKAMRAVSVGLVDVDNLSAPMRAARDAGLIRIHQSSAPELLIEFSSAKPVELHLANLGITLLGR